MNAAHKFADDQGYPVDFCKGSEWYETIRRALIIGFEAGQAYERQANCDDSPEPENEPNEPSRL